MALLAKIAPNNIVLTAGHMGGKDGNRKFDKKRKNIFRDKLYVVVYKYYYVFGI